MYPGPNMSTELQVALDSRSAVGLDDLVQAAVLVALAKKIGLTAAAQIVWLAPNEHDGWETYDAFFVRLRGSGLIGSDEFERMGVAQLRNALSIALQELTAEGYVPRRGSEGARSALLGSLADTRQKGNEAWRAYVQSGETDGDAAQDFWRSAASVVDQVLAAVTARLTRAKLL